MWTQLLSMSVMVWLRSQIYLVRLRGHLTKKAWYLSEKLVWNTMQSWFGCQSGEIYPPQTEEINTGFNYEFQMESHLLMIFRCLNHGC